MTRKQWKKLSHLEKRIKVAEICGLKNIHLLDGISLVYGYSEEDITWDNDVPQYLKDLNDIHQVLKNARFTQQQWSRYCDLLLEIAGKNLGGAFEATAEQRAEAFVLTLEGDL